MIHTGLLIRLDDFFSHYYMRMIFFCKTMNCSAIYTRKTHRFPWKIDFHLRFSFVLIIGSVSMSVCWLCTRCYMPKLKNKFANLWQMGKTFFYVYVNVTSMSFAIYGIRNLLVLFRAVLTRYSKRCPMTRMWLEIRRLFQSIFKEKVKFNLLKETKNDTRTRRRTHKNSLHFFLDFIRKQIM